MEAKLNTEFYKETMFKVEMNGAHEKEFWELVAGSFFIKFFCNLRLLCTERGPILLLNLCK
jgi:hypothetical protein